MTGNRRGKIRVTIDTAETAEREKEILEIVTTDMTGETGSVPFLRLPDRIIMSTITDSPDIEPSDPRNEMKSGNHPAQHLCIVFPMTSHQTV